MMRLYTVPQTAEQLQKSKRWVYDRIADGTLPAVELGTGTRSSLRVRADDLDAYIDARTTGAARKTA